MSLTSDFVRNLRSGDKVVLMVSSSDDTIRRIEGTVECQTFSYTIKVDDFILRSVQGIVNENVLAIQYVKAKPNDNRQ
jgi:hypothetical protein